MIRIHGVDIVHRVMCMLAEYLGTPAKVEIGVKSVIAASLESTRWGPGRHTRRHCLSSRARHVAREESVTSGHGP
jgi:hypothetical protein